MDSRANTPAASDSDGALPTAPAGDRHRAESATIRIATAADLTFVLHLQRKFSNQVGFLPTPAVEQYLAKTAITIATENGEPAGYLLGNHALSWQPLLRPITQAAVCFDAQRRRHGLQLIHTVEADAIAAGQLGLQANCREDLDANAFWRAAGFVAICRLKPDNARGRPVIVWRKPLTRKLPLWFAAPPLRAGHRASTPTVVDRDPRSRHGQWPNRQA